MAWSHMRVAQVDINDVSGSWALVSGRRPQCEHVVKMLGRVGADSCSSVSRGLH